MWYVAGYWNTDYGKSVLLILLLYLQISFVGEKSNFYRWKDTYWWENFIAKCLDHSFKELIFKLSHTSTHRRHYCKICIIEFTFQCDFCWIHISVYTFKLIMAGIHTSDKGACHHFQTIQNWRYSWTYMWNHILIKWMNLHLLLQSFNLIT